VLYLWLLVTLPFGFIMWYLYYGLECFINGGSIGNDGDLRTMLLPCLKQEFRWLMPFGDKSDIPRGFPTGIYGLFHFLFTHIFIPLSPTVVYIAFMKIWGWM
jgi:hypothetical protein